MHPLLKHPRGLAAYLLAWTLAGALLAAVPWLRGPTPWPWALAFALPVAWLTALAALSLYAVSKGAPLRPARWGSALLRRGAASAMLALVVAALAWLWHALGQLAGRNGLMDWASVDWVALPGALLLVFIAATLVHDALLAQWQAQQAAAAEAQARLHAREMELKALRAQLDPHFLFNSLNAISALVHADPAAARGMTVDLAAFLRQTLSLGDQRRIRLAQELELVQHYLAIEQRRLGDRLRVALDVAPGCDQAWLPPLVLQPLVENGIKHGIRHLGDGGMLELAAQRVGQRLVLRVSNPVDASAAPDGTGLGQGLRQLRARLQATAGDAAQVDIKAHADRFTVHLSMPWQT